MSDVYDSLDPASRLVCHPEWGWRDGMLDQLGGRLMSNNWTHPTTEPPAVSVRPNLRDPATAGVLLAILDEYGLLTDVVKFEGQWVVAIDRGTGPIGYAADTMGEAAAWALLAVWGDDVAMQEPPLAS